MARLCKEYSLNPFTAIATLSATGSAKSLILLAAEANLLRVYHHDDSSLLSSFTIFRSQAIHGIHCLEATGLRNDLGGALDIYRCLIWGGRSISILDLSFCQNGNEVVPSCSVLAEEVVLEDWVFDASLSPALSWTPGVSEPFLQAIAVTAHNRLLSINLHRVFDSDTRFQTNAAILCAGPSSILYSAHVVWDQKSRVYVAAGTVFGEVMLWSCSLNVYSGIGRISIRQCQLFRSFTGHEGSIFGVRISEPVISKDSRYPQRLLASCSDDRTVRLWDITQAFEPSIEPKHFKENSQNTQETGFGQHDISVGPGDQSLASAMGHLSRIWAVRFLPSFVHTGHLVTFGEDATCQIWRLEMPRSNSTNVVEATRPRLQPLKSLSLHSGKNIWAQVVQEHPERACSLVTGGADGRIQLYSVSGALDAMLFTSKSVRTGQKDPYGNHLKSIQKDASESKVFLAMEGEWTIHRKITSRLSTYPSGIFDGTATLTPRPPSDDKFDRELLYFEEGEFRTEQGMVLKGSRRYIYRYQASTNKITAWFVKVDDTTAVDYLFHEVTFELKDSVKDSCDALWAGNGHHLCIDDDYDAEYEFLMYQGRLKEWSLQYNVKGPKKDYVSAAIYSKAPHNMNLDHTFVDAIKQDKPQSKVADTFKSYAWTDENVLLTTTSEGEVLTGSLVREKDTDRSLSQDENLTQGIQWDSIAHSHDLRSQPITYSIPAEVTVLGGSDGKVYTYWPATRALLRIAKLPRKVAYLFVERVHLANSNEIDTYFGISTALGIPKAFCFFFSKALSSPFEPIPIDLPSNFIVTSSCFTSDGAWLFIGSRDGSIRIHKKQESPFPCIFDYVTTKEGVHGKEAVTLLKSLHASKGSPINVLSTGRDGRYTVQHFDPSSGQAILEMIHEAEPPFGPNIEGASFDKDNGHLSLWGFRSKDFVVWNANTQQEIMRVDCGGSHRNWAYNPLKDGSDGGNFVWTRASTCNVFSQSEASHKVLQSGGHGREIKAISIQQQSSGMQRTLIATGAEDTTIRISSPMLDEENSLKGLKTHAIVTRHVTGIQQLKWSTDGRYLFSAGGREEFCIWRIRHVPKIDIGVVGIAKCPTVTESGDLRVMDFDIHETSSSNEDVAVHYLISIVYSDSSIRIWEFNALTNEFTLQSGSTYTTACLTNVRFIHLRNTLRILTSSTDGHIAIFPVPLPAESSPVPTDIATPSISRYISHHRIHQNSIKSLELLPSTKEEKDIIVATGGDDNALGFTILTPFHTTTTDASLPELWTDVKCQTLLIPNAHASAINALVALPPRLKSPFVERVDIDTYTNADTELPGSICTMLSTSNDQTVKTWEVSWKKPRGATGELAIDDLCVKKGQKIWSTVADVACVGVLVEKDESENQKGGMDVRVMVAGIGVEVFRFE